MRHVTEHCRRHRWPQSCTVRRKYVGKDSKEDEPAANNTRFRAVFVLPKAVSAPTINLTYKLHDDSQTTTTLHVEQSTLMRPIISNKYTKDL